MATGEPGVVIVTTGPGATFTLTPLAESYAGSVPVVVVMSDVASHLLGRDLGALHEVPNQIECFRPVTRWAEAVTDTAAIPGALAGGFALLRSGRPGPIALSIPNDLLAARAEGWMLYALMLLFMVFVFGAIPFIDAMIVQYVDDRMRSRVAGMRLAVSFGVSALAVYLLGPTVKAAGFTTLLLLMAGISPFAERIQRMQKEYHDLTFVACQNTIERIQQELGLQAKLLPGVVVIDSGVAQIMRRQNQGWAYIQV